MLRKEIHPQTGRSRARVLFHFGRVDQVDRAALERLIQSVRRFLEPTANTVEALGSALQEAGLEFLSARNLGGCWLLDQLWRKLGLQQALHEFLRERGVSPETERAVLAMVANRALAPGSKLAVTDWLAEEAVLPDGEPGPLPAQEPERTEERKRRANTLYDAMDLLGDALEALQERVFWSISGGNFLEMEVDLLFLDTTTVYWETEHDDGEGGLRRRSKHSKDRRTYRRSCWVWR